jgi:hypothetical protein
MGTRSFPEVKCGRGVPLTPHPLLAPRSWKSRAIPLPPLWATTGPVTGLLYFILLYFTLHKGENKDDDNNYDDDDDDDDINNNNINNNTKFIAYYECGVSVL